MPSSPILPTAKVSRYWTSYTNSVTHTCRSLFLETCFLSTDIGHVVFLLEPLTLYTRNCHCMSKTRYFLTNLIILYQQTLYLTIYFATSERGVVVSNVSPCCRRQVRRSEATRALLQGRLPRSEQLPQMQVSGRFRQKSMSPTSPRQWR